MSSLGSVVLKPIRPDRDTYKNVLSGWENLRSGFDSWGFDILHSPALLKPSDIDAVCDTGPTDDDPSKSMWR